MTFAARTITHQLVCTRPITTCNARSRLSTAVVLCKRSPPGYYLATNPLVPTTALCKRCEGCPAAQCTPTGCSAAGCTIPGLTYRVALAKVNAAGQTVYACRPTSSATAWPTVGAAWMIRCGDALTFKSFRPLACHPALVPCHTWPAPATPQCTLQAFKTNANLPITAVWPASEFAGCGAPGNTSTGLFHIQFSDEGTSFSPADWTAPGTGFGAFGASVASGAANGTASGAASSAAPSAGTAAGAGVAAATGAGITINSYGTINMTLEIMTGGKDIRVTLQYTDILTPTTPVSRGASEGGERRGSMVCASAFQY